MIITVGMSLGVERHKATTITTTAPMLSTLIGETSRRTDHLDNGASKACRSIPVGESAGVLYGSGRGRYAFGGLRGFVTAFRRGRR